MLGDTSYGSCGVDQVAASSQRPLLDIAAGGCREGAEGARALAPRSCARVRWSPAVCGSTSAQAQHLNADLVVHYGNAFLSATHHLPVQYIFGRMPFDVDECVKAISSRFSAAAGVVVFAEVPYSFAIPEVAEKLRATHPGVVVARPRLDREGFFVEQAGCLQMLR